MKSETGEFISFVDSDNWIQKEMYEVLYKKTLTEHLDISTCDYTTIKNEIKAYISTRFINDDIKNFIIMNAGPCNMTIKRLKTLYVLNNYF